MSTTESFSTTEECTTQSVVCNYVMSDNYLSLVPISIVFTSRLRHGHGMGWGVVVLLLGTFSFWWNAGGGG